jgi:diphthamide biosynthesis methyltransferase
VKDEEILQTTGKITEIDESSITVEGEGSYAKVTVNIVPATYLNDGRRGKTLKLGSFKIGDIVCAYYSPKATKSLVPQSTGFAVVKQNAKNNVHFAKVLAVTKEGGSLKAECTGDIILTLDEKSGRDIKEGTFLLAWYDGVMLSLPAQANVQKVKILGD